MRKKYPQAGLMLLVLVFLLSGCNKGPSQEEVEGSEYYQALQKENKDLKNTIESLEEEVNDLSKEILKMHEENNEDRESSNKAEEYLKKIKKSSLIQVEAAYTDGYGDSVYSTNDAICTFMKKLVQKADLTANYTPEKLREEMGTGYIYTLYEEDDSIFQLEVYGDGYVIFRDLPGQVYYCPGSTSLGKALLLRKGSYPNSNLLHRMADSSLVVQKEKKAWDQTVCLEAANYINFMEKKEVNSNRESNLSKSYVFYSYGNQITLEIYKSHICIIGWDGEETWYQVQKEDITELNAIFS